MFKLGELALLGSKKNAYENACISRYPWHMKNGIKNVLEKHPGCVCGKEMIVSQCFDDISVSTKDMIIFCW